MLRSILLYLSKATWARRLVTSTGMGWRAASRFIAGETLDEAVTVGKSLNQAGTRVTLDYLGEHTTDRERAETAAGNILKIIERIDTENLRSGISIKLTQIGLALDEGICLENLNHVVSTAHARGIFVRIDMEDSPWVDKTLLLFRRACERHGPAAVGVVIQSYLYRSEEDLRDLLGLNARIRLCKGAYLEPPEVAFPEKADVDENFDRLMRMMIDASLEAGSAHWGDGATLPPMAAFATHDPARIRAAQGYLATSGLPRAAVEFQMLYGIQRDLQRELVGEEYPVRVYVPFGEEWYPYFMRRLAERPANVWFFLRHYFR